MTDDIKHSSEGHAPLSNSNNGYVAVVELLVSALVTTIHAALVFLYSRTTASLEALSRRDENQMASGPMPMDDDEYSMGLFHPRGYVACVCLPSCTNTQIRQSRMQSNAGCRC